MRGKAWHAPVAGLRLCVSCERLWPSGSSCGLRSRRTRTGPVGQCWMVAPTGCSMTWTFTFIVSPRTRPCTVAGHTGAYSSAHQGVPDVHVLTHLRASALMRCARAVLLKHALFTRRRARSCALVHGAFIGMALHLPTWHAIQIQCSASTYSGTLAGCPCSGVPQVPSASNVFQTLPLNRAALRVSATTVTDVPTA